MAPIRPKRHVRATFEARRSGNPGIDAGEHVTARLAAGFIPLWHHPSRAEAYHLARCDVLPALKGGASVLQSQALSLLPREHGGGGAEGDDGEAGDDREVQRAVVG